VTNTISSAFHPALRAADIRFSVGPVLSLKTLQIKAEWCSEKKLLLLSKINCLGFGVAVVSQAKMSDWVEQQ